MHDVAVLRNQTWIANQTNTFLQIALTFVLLPRMNGIRSAQ